MGAPTLPSAWQPFLKDHRISTFKNWPFLEGCACTPERMAEAGFIHCPTENEPDLAQCFFCFKELEGWEPDDDPIEEHKKHSSGCAFLSVKKQFEELTLGEFLKLDRERAKNKIWQRKPTIRRKNLRKLRRKCAVPSSSWLPWTEASGWSCLVPEWLRHFQGLFPGATSLPVGPLAMPWERRRSIFSN
ncbi:PREDICTED: baculoviral IAP repeat-containing protein 5 isoform X1 [Colobus angolensis palliatus]|uniref:baculoviral IAP repeat-containing protein 5 isoform X1 n=1 Tax=Colobus angolensis palliatus TaxID=336983 RepID=UPI0005F42F78|nr:PREDICTED: baculoviral IAP repeat-containing protein 5 isoform X1 [Colobus angolensis palliatus]